MIIDIYIILFKTDFFKKTEGEANKILVKY